MRLSFGHYFKLYFKLLFHIFVGSSPKKGLTISLQHLKIDLLKTLPKNYEISEVMPKCIKNLRFV